MAIPFEPSLGIDVLAQGAVEEHGATVVLPRASQIIGTFFDTIFGHHPTAAEEKTGIERTDTQFGIEHLGKLQAGIGSCGDITSTLKTTYLTIVKPLQTTVVDKVGGSHNGAMGEIASRGHIGLVGVLITADDAVVEQMGIC